MVFSDSDKCKCVINMHDLNMQVLSLLRLVGLKGSVLYQAFLKLHECSIVKT